MLNPYEDSRTMVLIFCFWSKIVIWVGQGWKLRYFFSFLVFPILAICFKFTLKICKFSPQKKTQELTNYSFNTYHSTLASWTLRPALHKESGPKKLGANFERFWVANWPPKFDGILFPAFGPVQCHKVQHLLVLGAD